MLSQKLLCSQVFPIKSKSCSSGSRLVFGKCLVRTLTGTVGVLNKVLRGPYRWLGYYGAFPTKYFPIRHSEVVLLFDVMQCGTELSKLFTARAHIFYKLRRNSFACPWEFSRAKKKKFQSLPQLLIIELLLLMRIIINTYYNYYIVFLMKFQGNALANKMWQ